MARVHRLQHVEDLGTYKILTFGLDGQVLKARLQEDQPVPREQVYLSFPAPEGPREARGAEEASRRVSDAHRLLDLPISVGIAPTKTLAKMGSKHNKPRGICILEQDAIQRFLRKKAIDDVPGFGSRLTPKLQSLGFETAADVANAPPSQIKAYLGKTGVELQTELNGIPVYPIITEPDPPKSISRCRSFRGTSDRNFLWAHIITHLQKCSTKLRRNTQECAGLGVWLRSGYEKKFYAERKFGRYISEEMLLLPFAREAFEEICHGERSRTMTQSIMPPSPSQSSQEQKPSRHCQAQQTPFVHW